MAKKLFSLAVMSSLFFSPSWADDAEEKKAEILTVALSNVSKYAGSTSAAELANAYPALAKNWEAYMEAAGPDHILAKSYALVRARAASAANDRKNILRAWNTVIELNRTAGPKFMQAIYSEAGHGAANARHYAAAQQYFAAARSLAYINDSEGTQTQLYMRIRELNAVGEGLEWRVLRDSLSDLKKFSEAFPMWTVPRLEAVLSEAEIRFRFQPHEEDKREDLAKLQAEIELMSKGMEEAVPQEYVQRIRNLNYALEDYFNL